MKEKSVKRYLFLAFFIIVVVLLCLIVRINIKYPNPEKQLYNMGESLYCENGLVCSVTGAGVYSEDEKEKMFQDIIVDEYELIGCYVNIEIVNKGDSEKRIAIGDYVLTSLGWKQSVCFPVFKVLNKNCKSALKPGESETYVLPYTISSNMFTSKQWKEVKNRRYSVVFSLYPVKREVYVNF